MKGIASFLVDKRLILLILTVVAAAVSVVMLAFVTVNKDMTQYLPEDSDMRAGLEIMEREFPEAAVSEGFKLMFQDLPSREVAAVTERISAYRGVVSVEYDANSNEYNSGRYRLFAVSTDLTDAKSTDALIEEIVSELKADYTVYSYYANTEDDILNLLLPIAFALFMLVLFFLCKSYIEILLLLASIGLSVAINMGTNIVFPSVSDMTLSIAAILQLVLSIDYSIMLFHRYGQERAVLGGADNPQAMKIAIQKSFGSVISSAFTTIVGLAMLLLMSFTIGMDIGLVMAKGILCSLICVFTVMPSLVLWCDGLILKTDKAYLRKKREKGE